MILWLLGALLTIVIVLGVLRLLRALPNRADITPSYALPAATTGLLAEVVAEEQARHPGLSGIIPLAKGNDALASRLALAQAATTSIDVQYYIWHDDISGRLLLGALYQAALRGVRVRLILDDNGITGLDPTIAALDALPNFDIRIFNPSTIRRPKILGFAYDFFRMNRRMHNKSFTVDGVASIIGGRNIGDEYFEIGDNTFFLDLDAIALGTVVPETQAIFDEYWNCPSVYPASQIISRRRADLAGFERNFTAAKDSSATQQLIAQYEVSADALTERRAQIEWTKVAVLADNPSKGEGKARGEQLMVYRLGQILSQAQWRIDLISAYFIPGKRGSELFIELAERGAAISILTNAFATTDVQAVHSGYIKYRRALLKAGIRLLELKPGMESGAGKPKHGITGSSSASLHAKTFAMDSSSIFIGSFNFDPRSAVLNCEMGFLIESARLAKEMEVSFTRLPYECAEPRIDVEGQMVWVEQSLDGDETIYTEEPDTTRWDRFVMRILGWFPIERLL